MSAACALVVTAKEVEVSPESAVQSSTPPQTADFAGHRTPRAVQIAADWIVGHADHRRLPFAIVDKNAAQIVLFDRDGRATATSTVLIGLAPGDAAAPDTSGRRPASLRPFERTTPAGRYPSEPGHNAKGEAIVWIDYDASLAIHRLRPAPAAESRPQRMASPRAADKRISYGCVVVPGAFYDAFVEPLLGRGPGIVYVLPESGPVDAMLGGGLRVGLNAAR